MEERVFGIVKPGTDINAHNVFGEELRRLATLITCSRVFRLVDCEGLLSKVGFGSVEVWLPSEAFRPIHNVHYAVGDTLIYRNKLAKIADVVWHHQKAEPINFLEVDGKKVSKRHFNEDLGIAGGIRTFVD